MMGPLFLPFASKTVWPFRHLQKIWVDMSRDYSIWCRMGFSSQVMKWLHILWGLATLPKTNNSPLKMDGWNTSFLLGWPIFMCYVSFRGGILSSVGLQVSVLEWNSSRRLHYHNYNCMAFFSFFWRLLYLRSNINGWWLNLQLRLPLWVGARSTSSETTLPGTNKRVYPWKMMLGRQAFPFGFRPIFRVELLLLGRVTPKAWRIG